ncbi:hypothetical protein CPter91_3873 [Collimonas pratensis]|uniref:Uncharacterized protein n=1 Tax=Collimonas pratensis TaxID=279113 RepID=A0A127Q842_9BURK|nr:hypothetical protein CPter91_3873 [Collimonas pratensis]
MGGAMFVLPIGNASLHAHAVRCRRLPLAARVRLKLMCNKYYHLVELLHYL